MWLKIVLILLAISVVTSDISFAQETHVKKDFPDQDQCIDSTHHYWNIESYSGSSRFTRFMYRLFYKPVVPGPVRKGPGRKLVQKPYSSFEGKIIRDIRITTLDPFGYSIGDTIVASQDLLSTTGNRFHIKTRESVIRNLLLVRENQIFDSLLVKESERLVRTGKYITDVSFFVEETSENSDSVDIFIRELDKWSIIPGGASNAWHIAISLRDDNFLGLGHEFQNALVRNKSTGNYAYKTKYHVPNFGNTYINSTLLYGTDEDGNFIKSIAVERPFFSPFAKWAAGIDFSQSARNDSVWAGSYMQYKFNSQDYWAGKATSIFKGNTEFGRTTRLISAVRFNRIRYLEKPPEVIDTLKFYTGENFYLASIGISSRQYVQDRYIFNFGITEDVPSGRVISLTTGYRRKNAIGMIYYGARFSSGKYHPWGYLGSNIEFGTFIHSSQAEEGVLNASLNYFTGLLEVGGWKIRQFIKPQFTIGINRYGYDLLTINEEYGLGGFNSPVLSGNSRLLLTSQTQSYAPWNFIGFHFGPYLILSLGMLGDVENGFQEGRVYSQFGLGVLIKNDNLVMNSFQVSLAFYPVIPGVGDNIIKFNSFQSFNFGFQDFETGKPARVVFR
jgi:hypothetical protein